MLFYLALPTKAGKNYDKLYDHVYAIKKFERKYNIEFHMTSYNHATIFYLDTQFRIFITKVQFNIIYPIDDIFHNRNGLNSKPHTTISPVGWRCGGHLSKSLKVNF